MLLGPLPPSDSRAEGGRGPAGFWFCHDEICLIPPSCRFLISPPFPIKVCTPPPPIFRQLPPPPASFQDDPWTTESLNHDRVDDRPVWVLCLSHTPLFACCCCCLFEDVVNWRCSFLGQTHRWSPGRGGGEANSDLSFENSWYPAQPHLIFFS